MRDAKLLVILRDTILGLVRQEGADLTARQMAVLLICYLEDGAHTVRGLAARLNVSKPAITGALYRLEDFHLAQRRQDPRDRRSIVVARTPGGVAYMQALKAVMEAVAA